ncbi:bifunctional metallophosphatase/5'-nucleotidase [Ruegeria marisrubri]|uniref:Bifunctional metallophosphatase/5'-nucleotidase n=1 Tax=Ruegeria marisrubri TaxID=1685379 RepID=A0A0X3TLE4_9RHOB|nr:bifunctional 2',3'-cyclic-nucleotide 2'-phosphodiesterase/3'-nucleotidase [Ruegeria marisrubri]KUJ76558.1 bifunctional metallophosphatase/5'-nucleotidase [Ruegeria marisrubri]
MENPPADARTARLRLLATTDLHMNLTGFDYYADRPDPTVGLTRTAQLIRAARREAESLGWQTLLVDNGDSLQGTALGDWAAEQTTDRHPLMQAFDLLGYDAVGLGNHDFEFGLGKLEEILAQSPCPVLCSNMRLIGSRAPWQPSLILNRTLQAEGQPVPIRVGVLSVLPPQTTQWAAHHLDGVAEVSDILETAEATAHDLRQQGCDVVIALAHSGLSTEMARPGLENAVVPLAAIDAIDAIVAGHTHLTLPGKGHEGLRQVEQTTGKVHGKPVVMPGSAGSHLGVIDLTLTRSAHDRLRVTESCSALRAIYGRDQTGIPQPTVSEDPQLTKVFAKGHAATRIQMRKPVGRTTTPLHSYFSFCAPDRGLALVAAAQAAALRGFLEGRSEAELPLLSATAPSKFGGRAGPRHYTDVPAGEMSMRHVADLHVFPNELRAVIVSGRQIRDWLEMSACLFNRIKPGSRDSALIDPSRAGHNFDVLHGLEYAIDPSGPARFRLDGSLIAPDHNRIDHLTWNGQPLCDEQHFVVALNNYRASGGGHFAALAGAEAVDLPPIRIQEILRDYIAGRRPKDPLEQTPPPWRFADLGGTQVILRTGPDARRYLGDIAALKPVPLGTDTEGFLQIRLTL